MSEEKHVANGAPEAQQLTRRECLLRLGEAGALMGVTGLVPGIGTVLSGLGQQTGATLPPGLYEASEEHLIDALNTGDWLREAPPGCETEYAKPQHGPFQPQFLSGNEFRVITRITGILLGNVDSGSLAEIAAWIDLRLQASAGVREAARTLAPLHRALAIAHYGQAAVHELETLDPQAVVRTGLSALGERSRERFGSEFLQVSAAKQVEVVHAISQETKESPLRHLYELVRTEAICGYYTSQSGLKELDYKGNAYYSRCPGCEAMQRRESKS